MQIQTNSRRFVPGGRPGRRKRTKQQIWWAGGTSSPPSSRPTVRSFNMAATPFAGSSATVYPFSRSRYRRRVPQAIRQGSLHCSPPSRTHLGTPHLCSTTEPTTRYYQTPPYPNALMTRQLNLSDRIRRKTLPRYSTQRPHPNHFLAHKRSASFLVL